MARSIARLHTSDVPLAAMLASWEMALEAENKSKFTIRSYGDSARALIRFAGEQATTGITPDTVRAFLAAELERIAPASVAVHHRNLRVFFGWLSREEPGLVPQSPMANITAPTVPKTRKPPLATGDLQQLLGAAAGNTFEDRRDLAIMRVFLDTGMRISGMAGLRYLPEDPEQTDVRLGQRLLVVRLKGGRTIGVPIGKKTVAALDRYLRARPRHRRADEPWLWLGPKGQFTSWGIRQMIERRGRQAGVDGANPHRWRRTFAHQWLESGGTEFDLMNITGWTSRDMIAVYTGELGEGRARSAHARLSPGDRI